MILGIATVVVLVLLAVALFPSKKRGGDATPSTNASTLFHPPAPSSNLREQQVQEEAEAIATEYQRRADEAWLEELSVKASNLLKAPTKTARKQ